VFAEAYQKYIYAAIAATTTTT